MTVNGRTEQVESAFYQEISETTTYLYLLREPFSELPEMEPDYYILIRFTESLNGKTLDLTRPLDRNSYLELDGWNAPSYVHVVYTDGAIRDDDGNPVAVTTGSLTLNRDGDRFTVKLSATLADGSSIAADWAGKATISR